MPDAPPADAGGASPFLAWGGEAALMGASEKPQRSRRALRFWVLTHLVLPVAVLPVKLWMATWRVSLTPQAREWVRSMVRADPPGAIAALHGAALCLIGAFVSLPKCERPRLVTLASPSRDGLLLANVLRRFGTETVTGSSRARGATGLLALVSVVRRGGLGLIAVDGPRGPRGVPKEGVLTLAKSVPARLYLVGANATPAMRVRSWDRMILPAPFARVTIDLRILHDFTDPAAGEPPTRESLQAAIADSQQDIGDPVD